MTAHWDVAIVGAGFSGALAAAVLARTGRRVLLLDRQTHPRFAIGESSTPIASLLLGQMAREFDLPELADFTSYGRWCDSRPEIMRGCKQGFVYLHDQLSPNLTRLSVPTAEHRKDADTQWLRADFDAEMCRIAVAHGAVFLAPVELTEWMWDGTHNRWQLAWHNTEDANAGHTHAQATLLIDTAGLGPKRTPANWKTASSARFAHYENVATLADVLDSVGVDSSADAFALDDAVVHVLTERGWWWFIRFDNGCVSVGEVINQRLERKKPPIATSASVTAALMRDARRISPIGEIKRLQWYRPKPPGPQFARLAGATGFVDALHSTGIAHSLFSLVRLLRHIVNEPVDSLHFSEALNLHHCAMLHELEHIDALIASSYAAMPNLDRFEAWVMLYFAAATSCEQALRVANEKEPPAGGFLGATDDAFQRALERAITDPNLHKASIQDLHTLMRRDFAAWNTASLWTPEFRGIYPYVELQRG